MALHARCHLVPAMASPLLCGTRSERTEREREREGRARRVGRRGCKCRTSRRCPSYEAERRLEQESNAYGSLLLPGVVRWCARQVRARGSG